MVEAKTTCWHCGACLGSVDRLKDGVDALATPEPQPNLKERPNDDPNHVVQKAFARQNKRDAAAISAHVALIKRADCRAATALRLEGGEIARTHQPAASAAHCIEVKVEESWLWHQQSGLGLAALHALLRVDRPTEGVPGKPRRIAVAYGVYIAFP
eukprot:7377410-Prymnesium_polylepis.1